MAFNLNDLAQFMEELFRETQNSAAETENFVNLTVAAKGRSSTAEILQWHLGGQLAGTRLLHGIRRIDHLRFDIGMIKALAKDRRGSDLNRITVVATMLGIEPDSVKKLLDSRLGGPRLSAASASATAGLQGAAYVTTAEIERFLVEYTTLALISRQLSWHPASVRRELKMAGILPAVDASSLGARIYRRVDVAAFIASQGTSPSMLPNDGEHAPVDAVFGDKTMITSNNRDFGESDDVIL